MGKLTLSPREVEIMRLICKSNPEIANKLNISLRWVKVLITKIMRKLNARNRTEALAKAAQKGYVNIFDIIVSED